MADCSYARCVQERRFIKRELQKWTKDMVHIVGKFVHISSEFFPFSFSISCESQFKFSHFNVLCELWLMWTLEIVIPFDCERMDSWTREKSPTIFSVGRISSTYIFVFLHIVVFSCVSPIHSAHSAYPVECHENKTTTCETNNNNCIPSYI